MSNPVATTSDHPCPICEKHGWCQIYPDKQIVQCRHVDQGAYKTKNDKSGVPYYLHRLDKNHVIDTDVLAALQRPSGDSTIPIASPDDLHHIYTLFLSNLHLTKSKDDLARRGIPTDVALKLGYRDYDRDLVYQTTWALWRKFGKKLLSVPGFIIKKSKKGDYYPVFHANPGLIIPSRDLIGRIQTLRIRRYDDPTAEKQKKKRYSCVTSKTKRNLAGIGPSPGTPCHVPLGIQGPAETVLITEGERKADIIYLKTNKPVISIAGVATWKLVLPILEQLNTKNVNLAFDADAAENENVANSLKGIHDELVSKQYQVRMYTWDIKQGKGLDDLIVAGGVPELIQGDHVQNKIGEYLNTSKASTPEKPVENKEGESLSLSEILQQKINEDASLEGILKDEILMEEIAKLSLDRPDEYAIIRDAMRRQFKLPVKLIDQVVDIHVKKIQKERNKSRSVEIRDDFVIDNGEICLMKYSGEGPPQKVVLCNFIASIKEEILLDDGVEATRIFAISGDARGGKSLPRVEVLADDYPDMKWVNKQWGNRAIIESGSTKREQLRTAIQRMSSPKERRLFSHTGWARINGKCCYVHEGGAITSNGEVLGDASRLGTQLDKYRLPNPISYKSKSPQLIEAIKASLKITRMEPMWPMWAAIYRAAFNACDFAIHLHGKSGTFKSQRIALIQQHWGPDMDSSHLPASWISTANSIEVLSFYAKDAIITVDDFPPGVNRGATMTMQNTFERIIRAQGNNAGRNRCNADGSLQAVKPPRGMILSSGEDVVGTQSVQGRVLCLSVDSENFDTDFLTACQADAASGKYALAMSSYISYLAEHIDDLRNRYKEELTRYRNEFAGLVQAHPRTPSILADLMIGLKLGLHFAKVAEAIAEDEYKRLLSQGREAILAAGREQRSLVQEKDPTGQFVTMLSSAFLAGRCHLGTRAENNAELCRWGWGLDPGYGDCRYVAQGALIGWIDDRFVYLNPDTSLAAVNQISKETDRYIGFTPTALAKHFLDKKLLMPTEDDRLVSKPPTWTHSKGRVWRLSRAKFDEISSGIESDTISLDSIPVDDDLDTDSTGEEVFKI